MASYIGNQIQRGEFKKLDSIESSYDGSTTTFNLVFNGTDVQVGDTTALVVSLNGVIQEPNEAYILGNGGSQIIFSSAPAAGNTCFITQLGGIGDTVTPTDGSVTASKIADNSITTTKLVDDSVTTAKLAPNLEFTGSYVKIPTGTTAERPATGTTGMLRFNTDFGRLEQFVDGGWAAIDTPPTLTSLSYSNSLLAADPAGGETITLTGDNLQVGLTVTVGGTAAASVTYIDGTTVQFTTPAKVAGDYDVKLTNANGLSATLQDGISYNGTPAFSTAAGQVGNDLPPSTTIQTITIVASEPDGGTLGYSITSGALPTGLSMDSSGNITGTTPKPAGTTTYNFTVTATDDENQTNSRAFNVVVLRPVYAYSINNSLMFNDDDSQYLQWKPESAGNRRTATLSYWIKRGNLSGGTQQNHFFFGEGSNPRGVVGWNDDDRILVGINYTGSSWYTYYSSALFRDPSAWYHIVVKYDLTNGTATDRIKLYVNGIEQSFTSTPSWLNSDMSLSTSVLHTIGANTGAGNKTDGHITEVNFIDGIALTPTSFAESYNDVWIPKAYSGSYGTNGFYLPMDETLYDTIPTTRAGNNLPYSDPEWDRFGKDAIRCNEGVIYSAAGSYSKFDIAATGQFTIEMWANFHRWNGDNEGFFWWGESSTTPPHGNCIWLSNSRNQATSGLDIYFNANGTNSGIDTGWSPTLDTWYHLAITYDNRAVKFYINGSLNNSFSISGSEIIGNNNNIGLGGGGNRYCNASFADIRVSNNVRYSSNFTPPTSEFTRDANTLWLIQNIDGANASNHVTGGEVLHDVNTRVGDETVNTNKLYPVKMLSTSTALDTPTG